MDNIKKGDIVQTKNRNTVYFVEDIQQNAVLGRVAVCKVYSSSERVGFKCSDLIAIEIKK